MFPSASHLWATYCQPTWASLANNPLRDPCSQSSSKSFSAGHAAVSLGLAPCSRHSCATAPHSSSTSRGFYCTHSCIRATRRCFAGGNKALWPSKEGCWATELHFSFPKLVKTFSSQNFCFRRSQKTKSCCSTQMFDILPKLFKSKKKKKDALNESILLFKLVIIIVEQPRSLRLQQIYGLLEAEIESWEQVSGGIWMSRSSKGRAAPWGRVIQGDNSAGSSHIPTKNMSSLYLSKASRGGITGRFSWCPETTSKMESNKAERAKDKPEPPYSTQVGARRGAWPSVQILDHWAGPGRGPRWGSSGQLRLVGAPRAGARRSATITACFLHLCGFFFGWLVCFLLAVPRKGNRQTDVKRTAQN